MEPITFIVRIGAALVVGMVIGLERQFQHKTAGLRTNALISLGASFFVLISTELTSLEGGDTTRIIGQVVTGTGFLCGGVILREGFSVKGLNTAATLWCCAALGCFAGLGLFKESFIGMAAVLFVNLLIRFVELHISSADRSDVSK